MRWFDKAAEELERDLEEGAITQEEFRRYMADLRAELQDAASEAARETYDDYMGN